MESFSKLGSMIGVNIKTNKHTSNKTMLQYAKVLIEKSLDGDFQDTIDFVNDIDVFER